MTHKQVTFTAPSQRYDTNVDDQRISLAVAVAVEHASIHSLSKSKSSSSVDVEICSPVDPAIEDPFEAFDYAELLPPVPDGGWGWMVCLGSFTINFILDGMLFSFGILMIALQTDLGHSKSLTACIGSTQMGLHMIMGPVISALLLRYSIRQVTLAGSLICSFGFIASFFAPNIYVLIITYGVIAGIGIGMVFLPAIIIVGVYFNEKRAIATGIATSGSGIGTFFFAYITSELLETYQWRGTLLILGGIVLNCFVCGMLFRPLNPTISFLDESPDTDSSYNAKCKAKDKERFYTVSCHNDNTSPSSSQHSTTNVSTYQPVSSGTSILTYSHKVEAEAIKSDSQTDHSCLSPRTALIIADNSRGYRYLIKKPPIKGIVLHHTTAVLYAHELKENTRVHAGCECRSEARSRGQGAKGRSSKEISQQTLHANIRTVINLRSVQFLQAHHSTNKSIVPSLIFLRGKNDGWFPGREYRILNDLDRNDNRDSSKKYSTSGQFKLGSDPSLPSLSGATKMDHHHYSVIGQKLSRGLSKPIMRKDIFYGGSISIEHRPEFSTMATFLAALTKTSVEDEEVQVKSKRQKVKGVFGMLCPLRLLENKVFILLLITFTMWTAQSVSMTYLPYFAMSIGTDKNDASFLISIVGVANLIGRPLAGLITDCCGIPSIWLYVLALSTAAGINFYIPFCESLIVLQVCSAIFGLCMAVSVSLRTIVLAQQLGIEALTESFGLVAFFQGLAYSINPPLAGQLIDDFKSYNPAFAMASIMYVVSALSSLGVGYISLLKEEEEVLYCVEDITSPDMSTHRSVEAVGRDSWHWTRDMMKASSRQKSFGAVYYGDIFTDQHVKGAPLEQKAHIKSTTPSPVLVSPTASQGIGVDSQGIGVDSQGIGVDSQGIGLDSQGIGVDSQGIGVDTVNISPTLSSSLKHTSPGRVLSPPTALSVSFSSDKHAPTSPGASEQVTRAPTSGSSPIDI